MISLAEVQKYEKEGIKTKEEYLKLVAFVERYNKQYHEENASDISDFDFDMANKLLTVVEEGHPSWVVKNSPSSQVGGKVKPENDKTVKHNIPMLSILDVFSKEDVFKWVNKVRAVHPEVKFSVEPKVDGLSASLRFRKTESNPSKMSLILAETRGDGFIGEDATRNAFEISDIPKTLDENLDYLEVRGEVFMTIGNFEKFNALCSDESSKKVAANPRNLAAGTFRALNPQIVKERGLNIRIFNLQDVRGLADERVKKSHTEALNFLEKLGFCVIPHKLCSTNEEIWEEIDRIGKNRGDYPFVIDGAVVKIDNISYRKEFTFAKKYSSGHIAFKYPPEEKNIRIKKINLSVGRTGKIAPTAVFEPVQIAGTTVQRVTVCNQNYIDKFKIGVGGVYTLIKSGEIIPKIIATVTEPPEIFHIPDICPVCGQKLVREPDTADYKCVNPSCPAQLKRTIAYFAGRDAMDIKALGTTITDKLVEKGYIHSYADLYLLQDNRSKIISEGFMGREKNVDKILTAIENSKQNSAEKVLTALGINNVGKSAAGALLEKFNDISEIAKAKKEDFLTIEDVGETTAESIVDFFDNVENQKIIDNLITAGVNMKSAGKSKGKLSGKTFCITGTLKHLGQKEAESLIEKEGGKVTGVSKKLQFLIVGENAGSKLDKARKLNVKIISENDFEKML